MFAQLHAVTLTVNSSGDLTTYTTDPVNGRVMALRFVIPGSGGLDTGADITITGEETGTAIITITNLGGSSVTFYPRAGVCGLTGTALTYDGTRTINEPVWIANERIKVVVAQGGNALTGTLYVVMG